jgi:hypothetical protein
MASNLVVGPLKVVSRLKFVRTTISRMMEQVGRNWKIKSSVLIKVDG